MVNLPVPFNVSPSIKLMRWTLLIAGVEYGIMKKDMYKRLELKRKPIREKEHHEHYEHTKELSKTMFNNFMDDMGAIFDFKIPPSWKT